MADNPKMQLVHAARIEVRWGDMDALGHVNNSRFFSFFEQARAEWMRVRGLEIRTDEGPILARTSCDYKRPVTYPAEITVEVYASEPRRSSMETTYRVVNGAGELCADGTATVVWFDFQKGRPIQFPKEMRELLLRPLEVLS